MVLSCPLARHLVHLAGRILPGLLAALAMGRAAPAEEAAALPASSPVTFESMPAWGDDFDEGARRAEATRSSLLVWLATSVCG